MRILITNDDGIQGPGLEALTRWAQKLGEVTVCAPKYEQSAKSHAIEIHKPFEALQVDYLPGITAYAVDSTPADCVRFAILGMHRQYDLVLSGINKGLNIGRDIMYSGTVSAIMEAACLNTKAIAFSTEPDSFDTAIRYLDSIYDLIQRNNLLQINDLYNVNIPLKVNGIRITRQGGPYFSDDFHPIGDHMHQPVGHSIYVDHHDYGIDTDATLHNYISVTPLTLERTNLKVFDALCHMNQTCHTSWEVSSPQLSMP